MLPRTGSTWTGDFGSSPGIVPTPASAPFDVCANAGAPSAAASAPAARASTNPLNLLNPDLARIARSRARGRRFGRRRHRLQLLAVLRIHRLGTAARRVVRDPVVHAE